MHEYTSTPFDRREYDANGNLTFIRTPDGQPKARLAYDYRNLLIEYTDYVAEQRHTYAYDSLGRRLRKVVNADGATPQTTQYLYDGGWQVVEERGSAGTVTYVHGAGLDEVVSMRRSGGSGSPPSGDYYFLADEQGSVVALSVVDGHAVGVSGSERRHRWRVHLNDLAQGMPNLAVLTAHWPRSRLTIPPGAHAPSPAVQ